MAASWVFAVSFIGFFSMVFLWFFYGFLCFFVVDLLILSFHVFVRGVIAPSCLHFFLNLIGGPFESSGIRFLMVFLWFFVAFRVIFLCSAFLQAFLRAFIFF